MANGHLRVPTPFTVFCTPLFTNSGPGIENSTASVYMWGFPFFSVRLALAGLSYNRRAISLLSVLSTLWMALCGFHSDGGQEERQRNVCIACFQLNSESVVETLSLWVFLFSPLRFSAKQRNRSTYFPLYLTNVLKGETETGRGIPRAFHTHQKHGVKGSLFRLRLLLNLFVRACIYTHIYLLMCITKTITAGRGVCLWTWIMERISGRCPSRDAT